MTEQKPEWMRHPRYLADAGGLFGAPPQLRCQYCFKNDYELFYGHCRPCADNKNIPQKVAPVEVFNRTIERGSTTVMQGAPKEWWPWWHWRRWFVKK